MQLWQLKNQEEDSHETTYSDLIQICIIMYCNLVWRLPSFWHWCLSLFPLLKHPQAQWSQRSCWGFFFFFPDGKTATVYHYGSLPVLSNHCSQVGCEPLLCRRGTASACCAAPGCSGIFIIFKEAAPSWVVLAMCRPGLCVNMCVSECVCVREFVPCCLHVLWINSVRVVLQACVFAQNCTSHGFPSHVISHDCNLRGW